MKYTKTMLAAIVILAILSYQVCDSRYVAQHHPLAMDNYGILTRGHAYNRLALEEPRTLLSKQEGVSNAEDEKRSSETDWADTNWDYPIYSIDRWRRTEAARERELKELYNDIAREFPFLAKQGLQQTGKVPSLKDLFSMTVFGQPSRH